VNARQPAPSYAASPGDRGVALARAVGKRPDEPPSSDVHPGSRRLAVDGLISRSAVPLKAASGTTAKDHRRLLPGSRWLALCVRRSMRRGKVARREPVGRTQSERAETQDAPKPPHQHGVRRQDPGAHCSGEQQVQDREPGRPAP
jgi:hypothetical protein